MSDDADPDGPAGARSCRPVGPPPQAEKLRAARRLADRLGIGIWNNPPMARLRGVDRLDCAICASHDDLTQTPYPAMPTPAPGDLP